MRVRTRGDLDPSKLVRPQTGHGKLDFEKTETRVYIYRYRYESLIRYRYYCCSVGYGKFTGIYLV